MGSSRPCLDALFGVLLGFLAVAGGALGVLLLAAFLLLACRGGRGAPWRVFAWAAALGAAASLRWQDREPGDELVRRLGSSPVRVVLEGRVRGAEPPAPEGFELLLDVEAWEDAEGRRKGRGGARVRVEGAPPDLPSLHAGDDVRLVGRLARLPAATNPGVFDPIAFAGRRGIHARLDVPDPGGVEQRRASDGPLAGISQARHAAARALDAAFLPADAGLLRSLLLGDRGALDEADRERFRAAGAAHVLAISGAHVALLVAGLLFALRRLRVPSRLAAGFVLLAVLALVPFTGGAPPVLRSAAGAGLFLVGRLMGREPSSGTLLAVVAAGFLVLDPSSSEDPGFRMSFAAAAGLVTLAPRLRRAFVPAPPLRLPGSRPPRAPVRTSLAAGLAAWVASTPIAVHDLGQAGAVAVPIGILVVPLSTLTLLLGAAAAWAAPWPLAGPLLVGATTTLLDALRAVLDAPRALGWMQGAVASPGALWYVVYALGLLALARARWPLALLGSWVLLVALVGLADASPGPPPPHLRLTLFDVGHGQALLLEAPDGTRALLDAGSRDRPDPAARILSPALRALRVPSLDLASASHADADHAGALAEVLARVPSDLVVVPPHFDPAVRAGLEAAGTPILVTRAGDVLLQGTWGRLVVRAPSARARPPRSRNDACLVLAIETPAGNVLLPGDREALGVEDLLEDAPDLAAKVLLLPHHGHPGPGLDRLLARLAPRLLLASAPRSMASRLPPGTASTGVDGALVLEVTPRGFVLSAPWKDGGAAGQEYLSRRLAGSSMRDPVALALAAALLAGISFVATRLRWLTTGGAVGAAWLGLAAVHAFGWPGLVTLLAPFLAGTLAGKLPGGDGSDGPRRLRQVAANGLPAVLGIALAWSGDSARGALAFTGALAALGADTLATEFGTRWGGTPRHALTGRPLRRGESGGVTAVGLLASVGGALLAPVAGLAVGGLPTTALLGVAGAGALAAFADSLLGALVQRKGRCATCGRLVEGTRCCEQAPRRLAGRLGWLDNDVVNLLGGLVGAGLALALVA